MSSIYLDHSASTPLLPEAWDAMKPWVIRPGNAASSHAFGRAARKALDDARGRIASCLDCDAEEILFTSGATEANNLAIFGLAGDAPGDLLVSAIEHPCVWEPIQKLVGRGFRSVLMRVHADGRIEPPGCSEQPGCWSLATLMLANHETGVIQPVEMLRRQLPAKTPLHCDAAAAVGKMPVSFRHLGVSTLAFSSHKFHGPVGIGALIVRRGAKLTPLFAGGHQQHGKRPGTEPVALAVGMATALEWATQNLDAHIAYVRQLRTTLVDRLRRDAGPIVVNGREDGVPHVVNIAFPGLNADALLMALDLAGVACSTGSACSSGSLLPSPVLKATGVADDVLRSAMRFSFSSKTSLPEAVEAAERISKTVNRLRHVTKPSEE